MADRCLYWKERKAMEEFVDVLEYSVPYTKIKKNAGYKKENIWYSKVIK